MQSTATLAPTPGRTSLRRRVTAGCLALGIIAVLAACEPALTTRQADQNAADAAATWLAADFQANGSAYAPGQLADTVLSLAALGDRKTTAVAALDALETATPTYVNPGGTVNAGATAKVMLAVQAMRGNVKNFAGLDLEAMLRGSMVTSGANTGRLGTSTGLTQALGVLTLSRTAGKVPADAATWLIGQQCPDGGFSSGPCAFESPDATGLALTALVASPSTPARDAAFDGARSYLVTQQHADGGWGSSNSDTVSNTNSTGLASQALRLSEPAKSVAGANFVKSVQYPASAGTKAGAIPWKATVDSSLQMATTQAVLAFGSGSYATVVFPKVVGQACEGTEGVTVVVDLALFDGTIRQGCAVGAQTSGWTALENAGFTVGSVPGFEGSAICTINAKPSGGYPDCWYNGFWAYWHSTTNDGQWAFSDFGAANRTPPLGSVEGWRYEPDLYNHWAAAPGIPAPVNG